MRKFELSEKIRALLSEDEFENWWNKYAYENRITDTRMIRFAEEIRSATIEEILKLFKD